MESLNNSQEKDDRFWRLSVDKAGNGAAIIRFLPASENDEVEFVRYWDHGFQGPGGWYIEKSLTSLGEDDPVSEFNSELWNASSDDNSPQRKQARNQKRRLHYVSNILVVNDPANPENNGKVFLYEYGKRIMDKIKDAMYPDNKLGDEEPMNPFDMWEGANFRLKAKKVDGQRNYNESHFESPSAISDDESKLEEIYNSMYTLKDLVDPSVFKSYSELKKRLEKVLGQSMDTPQVDKDDLPEQRKAWTPPKSAAPAEKSMDTDDVFDDDDDDSLDYFQKLANE